MYSVYVCLKSFNYVNGLEGRVIINNELSMWTTNHLIAGGDPDGEEPGFLGCMRNLEIGTESISQIRQEWNSGVVNGTCMIQDR